MERWLEAQLLFENGYEDIGADRDPYLGLHRIGRGAEERLDPQVLFDPLEEQLHLPAHLVELCDYVCGQRHVVGQKDEHWVEKIVVYLVLSSSKLPLVQRHVKAILQDHETPKEWHCVQDLPLTDMGKVMKLN